MNFTDFVKDYKIYTLFKMKIKNQPICMETASVM